jgi:hypothetical protein
LNTPEKPFESTQDERKLKVFYRRRDTDAIEGVSRGSARGWREISVEHTLVSVYFLLGYQKAGENST